MHSRAFYGNNPVNSDVKTNEKTTIDGHEAWLVESHLTFDIAGLKTKGASSWRLSRLATGQVSTTHRYLTPRPLVQPARDALAQLQVDG